MTANVTSLPPVSRYTTHSSSDTATRRDAATRCNDDTLILPRYNRISDWITCRHRPSLWYEHGVSV